MNKDHRGIGFMLIQDKLRKAQSRSHIKFCNYKALMMMIDIGELEYEVYQ